MPISPASADVADRTGSVSNSGCSKGGSIRDSNVYVNLPVPELVNFWPGNRRSPPDGIDAGVAGSGVLDQISVLRAGCPGGADFTDHVLVLLSRKACRRSNRLGFGRNTDAPDSVISAAVRPRVAAVLQKLSSRRSVACARGLNTVMIEPSALRVDQGPGPGSQLRFPFHGPHRGHFG